MRPSPLGNTINGIDVSNHEKVEKEILVKKLYEAVGLTLDIENEQMYMTDLAGAVYTAKMDGSDEKVLFSDLCDLTGTACCTI